MKQNREVYLGEKFISTTLENAAIKEKMTAQIVPQYLMRAAMAGVIVIFGYLIYFALAANYAGSANEPSGKVIAGFFFSFCLVTIYYTKSELLTSNMMITTVGRYCNKITTKTMFRILGLCYLGNIIGGIFFGMLVGASTIINPGMEDVMAHSIADKLAYIENGALIDLMIRAIFCNFFINIAMLMVYSGNIKDDFAKIIAMAGGVFIFMYLGLEHSVANTVLFSTAYFFDLFHETDHLTIIPAIQNLFWVLIGNYIGGGILIGLYYSIINNARNR